MWARVKTMHFFIFLFTYERGCFVLTSYTRMVCVGGCVILCELSPLQKTIYQSFLEQEDFELIATSQLICSCGSGEKQGYCCRVVSGIEMHVPLAILLLCGQGVSVYMCMSVCVVCACWHAVLLSYC